MGLPAAGLAPARTFVSTGHRAYPHEQVPRADRRVGQVDIDECLVTLDRTALIKTDGLYVSVTPSMNDADPVQPGTIALQPACCSLVWSV